MKWRIRQTSSDVFRIDQRFEYWPFWFEVDYESSLESAQKRMEQLIMHKHTFPRVVDKVTDEVGFVRARLKK